MNFTIDKSKQFSTIYKYNFSNLTDLYNYLKSDPKINSEIFQLQVSMNNKETFAGESLDKAIEYLKGGYKINFEKFDIGIKLLEKSGYEDTDSRKLERSLHGGVYLSPLVAAGVPDCMIKYQRDTEPKHITIYYNLGYPYITTPNAILNRGIATINLIKTLEDKGYIVDLKVFQISKEFDENAENEEYIDITINLKNTDEPLNISRCYYPFVGKEFVRRLMFRCLESAPVKFGWGVSYGRTLDSHEIRDFYKLKEKDIIISAPNEMGIKGLDIFEDTISLFEKLELDEEFDLSKLKTKVKR